MAPHPMPSARLAPLARRAARASLAAGYERQLSQPVGPPPHGPSAARFARGWLRTTAFSTRGAPTPTGHPPLASLAAGYERQPAFRTILSPPSSLLPPPSYLLSPPVIRQTS